MKVIFLTTNLTDTGGVERVISVLANSFFEKLKYKVGIINRGRKNGNEKFYLNPNINIKYADVEYRNSKTYVGMIVNFIINILKLKRYLNKLELQFDDETTIIATGAQLSLMLPFLFNRKKFILIGTQHNPVKHNLLVDMVRNFTLKKLKYYIVLDSNTKEDMEKYTKIKNIGNIPNPLTINNDDISNLNKKTVVSVGRLTEQKGFDLLIKSWKYVNEINPDWNLIIVGEGELLHLLNNLILEMNLTAKIQIKSYTDNIEKYYLNASIYALSSRYEGFGLVILEAQNCGLPVVAYDCPTGPENIINNEVDGYLIEPNNIIEFANKINELIGNEDKKMIFSKNALKNTKRFSIEETTKKWRKVIEN